MNGSTSNLATTPETFLARRITHFLPPRRLWLIFLEVVVMRLAFDFTYNGHARYWQS
jgi:hypothetical protein